MVDSGDAKIRHLIDDAIRRHEIRVAVGSGALGAAILLGTFHAIGMLRHELHALAIIGS